MIIKVLLFLCCFTKVYLMENASERNCHLIDRGALQRFDLVLGYEMSMLSAVSYAPWTELSYVNDNAIVDFEVGYNRRNNMRWRNIGNDFCAIREWMSSKVKVLTDFAFFKSYRNKHRNMTSVKGISGSTLIRPRPREGKCPSKNAYRYPFRLLWFMDGWSVKGLWHDTEMLIAESKHSIVFVFRGTENAADILTSARRYVPASRSTYAGRAYQGALHGGMLSAYSRVDRGTIMNLNDDAEKGSRRFDRNIHDVYRNCSGRADHKRQGNTCVVRDVSLSVMLVEAAVEALRMGKRVICTGHSLGGGLASLMALDILVNAPHNPTVRENGEDVVPLLRHLYLITFGEPEVADNSFFHDLFSRYDHIAEFAAQRYRRFVSLSRAPQCLPDVVTTVTARIDRMVGGSVMGLSLPRRSGWMRRKGREVSGGANAMHPMYKQYTEDSWGVEQRRRMRRHKAQVEKVPSPGVVVTQRHQLESDNERACSTADRIQSAIPPSRYHNQSDRTNDTNVANGPEVMTRGSSAPPERLAYFTPPTYLCSGRATSSLQAHGLVHYSRGLVHAARDSALFASIHVEFLRDSNVVRGLDGGHGPRRTEVKSRGDSAHLPMSREARVLEEGGGQGVVLMHKVPPPARHSLDMLHEECLVEAMNGFGAYVC